MSKTFWAVIAIIVVLFGGVILFKGDKAAAPSNAALATNHVKGDGQAGVKLVEYGDYQCPACYRYEPVVEAVFAKYQANITFQFRNLPLIQVHDHAFAAARAAEAAAMQNKFWEMHDLLYQNQTIWSQANNVQTYFEQYARQLGLDVTKFKQDAASSKVNDIINADTAAFNKTGATMSTPSFFLDGKNISVGPDVDSFSKVLDEAIKKASS